MAYFRLRGVAFGMAAAIGLLADAGENIGIDFEQGYGFLKPRSKEWRIDEGKGVGGSKCLTLEYPESGRVRWLGCTRFEIEPGCAYKMEAWVDASQLKMSKAERPSVGITVYDGQGKRVYSRSTEPVVDNEVRRDSWRRYECVTRTLPASARTAEFYIWIDGKCSGTVRFDDMSLKPAAANPVDTICVSAYRAEAWEGDVTFRAGYYANPFKNPDGDLECVLEYAATNGTGHAVGTTVDGIASVTVPVAAFAYGRNKARLAVRRKDGTAVLGDSSCEFTREACPMPRKVTFDSVGRTIVDGKPFFPLGMYWGTVTAEDLVVYTNGAPFNCLMPYGRTEKAHLDLCEAVGVKVIYGISGFFKSIAKAKTPQKAAEIEFKYPRANLRRYRTHPAILAWYLADEVPAEYAPILAARRRMVHELDPDHPSWIVIDWPSSVRPLIDGYDVFGMDPYPIGNHGGKDRTEIARAAKSALSGRESTYGLKPMWQVPQAFDWGYYRPTETNRTEVRMPTCEEMRSMTWQAIAGGANGIVFYSFFDLLKRDNWPKERTAGGWESACTVAKEVKAKEAVLLSDPGPAVESAPENTVCRTWRTGDGTVHLLVCNMTREPVKGAVKVDGREVAVDMPAIGVKWEILPSRAN